MKALMIAALLFVVGAATSPIAQAGSWEKKDLVWKLELEHDEVSKVALAIKFIPEPEARIAVQAGWGLVQAIDAAGGNKGVEITGVLGTPTIFVSPKGKGPYKYLVDLQARLGKAFRDSVQKVDSWLVKVDPGRAVMKNGQLDKWFGKRRDDEPETQQPNFDGSALVLPPKDVKLKYQNPVVISCLQGGKVLDGYVRR